MSSTKPGHGLNLAQTVVHQPLIESLFPTWCILPFCDLWTTERSALKNSTVIVGLCFGGGEVLIFLKISTLIMVKLTPFPHSNSFSFWEGWKPSSCSALSPCSWGQDRWFLGRHRDGVEQDEESGWLSLWLYRPVPRCPVCLCTLQSVRGGPCPGPQWAVKKGQMD